MHSTVRQHLVATFFAEYQGLRVELMDLLADVDLDYHVGATAPSLGALCRGIGEVERSYVDSFRTFRQDFGYRHADSQVEHSVARLASWYADLDGELMDALEQLSEVDTTRRIIRSDFEIDDFAPVPTVQLDIYREALLIFYGKASVYIQSMGKELPARWEAWIG